MQDPTKKWTQTDLMDLAYSKKERNISKTLSFVDSMMRLREYVFRAQSLQRTIHQIAVSEEPVTNEMYSYYEDTAREFRHSYNWVFLSCLIDYPKEIDKLNISQKQRGNLLAKVEAAGKFIDQVRKDPQNDRDMKKIIHRHVDLKWKDL